MENPKVAIPLIIAECILVLWGLYLIGLHSDFGAILILLSVLVIFSELMIIFGKSSNDKELYPVVEY